MGLRLKFNLMLLIVFLAGFAAVGVVAHRYLERQAIDDAQRAAMVVLDAASFAKLDPRIASGLGSRLVDMKIREFSLTESLSGIEGQVMLRLKSNSSGQMTEVITSASGERRLAVALLLWTCQPWRLRSNTRGADKFCATYCLMV